VRKPLEGRTGVSSYTGEGRHLGGIIGIPWPGSVFDQCLTRESVCNSILVALGEDYCTVHALKCRLFARVAITIELVPT